MMSLPGKAAPHLDLHPYLSVSPSQAPQASPTPEERQSAGLQPLRSSNLWHWSDLSPLARRARQPGLQTQLISTEDGGQTNDRADRQSLMRGFAPSVHSKVVTEVCASPPDTAEPQKNKC
ncbi:hypothetical protein NDU88_006479 [Pleurodeles waltl]|uniref:Uncharacterized protein n=1 Tax=Pleurodeles waltl TaxID=8319 RepID=A0AAV7TEA1_PLEWA|nr:hypothetical protein NDU88_006479 [Pleurodeles waltl]